MRPCRVAFVRYLNTAPLMQGLELASDLRLIPAVPSRIASMVARGEADLGLASVVDALAHAGTLRVLPVGMIGCDGPTLTVRVYSRVPPAQITRLHADTDSHTSVVLARVLLARVFNSTPEIIPHDTTLDTHASRPESVLLIGDKVITHAPSGDDYPHQLDLGEAWKRWTGLPFVYAAWMCREGEHEPLRAIASLLDRQRRRNAMRLGWVVATRATAAGWPVPLAARYLGSLLRYDLSDAARAGLDRFLAEAAALGVLPARELVMAP